MIQLYDRKCYLFKLELVGAGNLQGQTITITARTRDYAWAAAKRHVKRLLRKTQYTRCELTILEAAGATN